MKIEINYNGKKYDDITKAVVDQMKDQMLDLIKPFESEIKKEGGKVILNFPYDLSDASLKVTGISDDLEQKINTALK